jgi:hypothetical protein
MNKIRAYILLSTIFWLSILFSYNQKVVHFFLPYAPDGDIEGPSLFLLKICLICIFTPLFIFLFPRWVSCFQKAKWVPDKLEAICLILIVTLHGVAILLPKVSFLWSGEDSIAEILSFIFPFFAAILTLRIAIKQVIISQKIYFFVFLVFANGNRYFPFYGNRYNLIGKTSALTFNVAAVLRNWILIFLSSVLSLAP